MVQCLQRYTAVAAPYTALELSMSLSTGEDHGPGFAKIHCCHTSLGTVNVLVNVLGSWSRVCKDTLLSHST